MVLVTKMYTFNRRSSSAKRHRFYMQRTIFIFIPECFWSLPLTKNHVQTLMDIWSQRRDATFNNLRTLVKILLNSVELFHIFRPTQEFHKIFIMCYYKQLKVTLLGPTFDYPMKKQNLESYAWSRPFFPLYLPLILGVY